MVIIGSNIVWTFELISDREVWGAWKPYSWGNFSCWLAWCSKTEEGTLRLWGKSRSIYCPFILTCILPLSWTANNCVPLNPAVTQWISNSGLSSWEVVERSNRISTCLCYHRGHPWPSNTLSLSLLEIILLNAYWVLNLSSLLNVNIFMIAGSYQSSIRQRRSTEELLLLWCNRWQRHNRRHMQTKALMRTVVRSSERDVRSVILSESNY